VLCCVSGALEDGIRCGERALPSLASYESNVLYALRFMVDTNMGGGQWLEIPAGALHQN
jgi:DNA polymerase delta subunit 1